MKYLITIIALLFAISAYGADVQLAWDEPTTNADGTPLTDLAGYKVYRTTVQGDITGVTGTDVGNVTTWTDVDVPEGTYYYTATAYDTNGNESETSNYVTTTLSIPPSAPANATCQATIINNCIGCIQTCE